MYELLKEYAFRILGKELLKKNETVLRKIFLYPLYIGNTKTCKVCNKHLRKFIHLSNGELVCPFCGSLKRNRRLIELVEQELKEGTSILEFSPSKCLYDKFKRKSDINYTGSDFVGEFMADKHFDITNIEEPSESYTIILCYHILEHVENDLKAMSELYRVMKKDGSCFIQTPFQDGDIYEDPTIVNPEERTLHFGQHDHVRIYSVNGLKRRLESAGFQVEVMEFVEPPENKYGFSENETVLLATKA